MKSNEAAKVNFIDLKRINQSVESEIGDSNLAERIKTVQTALTMIPQDHREVLIMKRYQDLKNKEIAEILQCSENTVKGKVHRAELSLRKAYFTLEKKNQ
jgi:RNA polymerase sigma-70 factor (ECF subfamily)